MKQLNSKRSGILINTVLAAGIIFFAIIPENSFAYLPSCTFLNGSSQAIAVHTNSGATDISALLTVVARTNSGSVIWTTSVTPANGTLVADYTYSAPSGVATHTITPSGLTYMPAAGFSGMDSFVVNTNYDTYGASMTIYVTVATPSYIFISAGTNIVNSGDVDVAANIDSFINYGIYTDNSGALNVFSALNFSGTGSTYFDSLMFNTTSGTSLINQMVTVSSTTIINTGSSLNANNSLSIATGGYLVNNGTLTNNVQGLVAMVSDTTGSSSYISDLTLNVSGTEMVYQWQSSTDSSTWVNVSGATNATYTATITATTYYRCELTTLNTSFSEPTPGVRLYFAPAGSSGSTPSSCGIITTYVGNDTAGYTGDGGPATAAELHDNDGIATDAAGNLYIADYSNAVIRCVSPSGIITTVAGNGTLGYSGDGGPATAAEFKYPVSVSIDRKGNKYICDFYNHAIRKIDTNGIITTIAGTGTHGFSGDGGPATAAQLYYPENTAIDSSGNIYIADYANQRIRKINTSGIITTVAGGTTTTYTGGTVAATSVALQTPFGIAVDNSGNFYFSDREYFRVLKVDASGTMSPFAGDGSTGFSGDGGPATAAELYSPVTVIFHDNNIYISDLFNYNIRKVDASGTITTIAGSETYGYTGDGGAATAAEFKEPDGIAFDQLGNMYISDPGAEVVRKIGACALSIAAITGNRAVCSGDTIMLNDASPGGTWTSSNSTIAAVDTNGVVAGLTAGTDTISYITSLGAATYTVIVNASPDAGTITTTVSSFCATAYISNSVTGTSGGIWTSSNPAVGSVNASSGVLHGLSEGTVTLTYAVSSGTCTSVATSIPIWIKALSDTGTVSPASGASVCAGSTITYSTTGTTVGTGYFDEWLSSDHSVATVNSSTGVVTGISAGTATITYVASGCGTWYVYRTLTVQALPAITMGASPTVTQGTTAANLPYISTSGSPVSYSITYDAVAHTAGLTDVIGVTMPAASPFSLAVPASITTGIYNGTVTLTNSGGCTSDPEGFTIDIVPPGPAPITGRTTVCAGDTIILSDDTTTGAWSSSNASIASISTGGVITGLNAGTDTISYTTATGVATYTVSVHAMPDVNGISSQTLCNNAATTAVSFTGSLTGTVYAWTNNNTAINLASSGTGNIASFEATNATSAVQTATITVSPSANGCTGSSTSFMITVNPTPDVTGYSSQSVCNNGSTSAISFTGDVSGTAYSWTNSDATTGIGASGSGNIAAFTATNSSFATHVSTITVTPAANSCEGTAGHFTITVYPTPDVSDYANQSVCNGSSIGVESFSGDVSGTTYSWSNNNTSIGLAASGVGSIASFTGTNSAYTTAVATITITPTANSCTGTAETFSVTVYPTPDVSTVPDQTVCNNAPLSVSFGGEVSITTYTWDNNNTSTGLDATGTGDIASFTATNSGSAASVATVTVTPSANGCAGTPITFNITVNPTPTVTAVGSQTVCNTTSTEEVIFGSTVPGTTYSWTNNNTAIGLAASGTGNIAAFDGMNDTYDIISGTVVVSPAANTCVGVPDTFTITVSPTPDVTVPSSTAICNTFIGGSFTFSGDVGGTTYSWSNTNATIGVDASGTGSVGTFTATNTTTAPIIGVITVVPSANDCPGTTQSFTVTVNPTPLLSTALTPAGVCDSTLFTYGPSSLTAGTTFTWSRAIVPGISNLGAVGADTINELLVNSTTDPIIVTYVDTLEASGCSTTQSLSVVVNPRPVLSTTLTPAAICDSTLFTYGPSSLTAGTSYTWSRATVSGITNTAASGADTIFEILNNTTIAPVTVTYIDTLHANGCSNTEQVNIVVNPKPLLSTTLTPAAVCDSTRFTYDPYSLTAGTTYTWSRAAVAGITNAATSGVDTINETLVNSTIAPVAVFYIDTLHANGCINEQAVSVTVNPMPVLTSPITLSPVCDSTTFAYTSASATAGTSYTWSRAAVSGIANGANNGIDSISEQLVNDSTAPAVVVYIDTLHANGCINAEAVSVLVNPLPTMSSTLTPPNVCDSGVFNYTPASSDSGVSGYAWSRAEVAGIANTAATGSGNPSEQLINITNGDVSVTYIYTVSANGCSGEPYNVTFTVVPTPKLSTPLSDSICSGSPFTYSPEGTTAGTAFSWNRAATTDITNTAAIGMGSIDETLKSTAPVAVYPVYVYTMSYDGCSFSQNLTVKVNPVVAQPVISVAPSPAQCSNTMYQNFGAQSGPPSGVTYTWTANNAQVWSTGTTGQYSLVNFLNPGVTAVITLTATSQSTQCLSATTYSVAVSSSVSPDPTVIYASGQFMCLDRDVDSYQWGYDEKTMLDSSILAGEINQIYINNTPDRNKYYWVQISKGECQQKAYSQAPTGVTAVNTGSTEVKVYPNPASDVVNIQITTTEKGGMEAELISVLGQHLLSQLVDNNNHAQLNINGLESGTYIVNCYRDGIRIYSAKVIKN